jgi:hypothetical protein
MAPVICPSGTALRCFARRATHSRVIPRCASSPYFVIPGRATWREPGIHNHETQFGARWGTDNVGARWGGPVVFKSGSGGCGFRARVAARPGMTVVGQFLSALPLTPTLSPQAGRGRRGAATCAIHGHSATDNRWPYLSPQRGERSDCKAIRVRGKAHRGIHGHGICWGMMGRRSCSTSRLVAMDSGLAPSGAPRNDGGGSIPFSRCFPSPRPSPRRRGEGEGGAATVRHSRSYCC